MSGITQTLLEFVRRLKGSARPSRSDDDLEQELQSHLELAADREARPGAHRSDIALTLDKLRDQRGLPWLDALRADVVFGWRQIRRHRIASIAAILSLGLTMGAALAAFRLVDAILLRPLPVADPSRLFVVTRLFPASNTPQEERDDFDYPTYQRYADRIRGQADAILMGMAVRRRIAINPDEPETIVQQFVSGNAFAAFGLEPALGRLIGEADDTIPGGHPVVVLTHDYWQRRYGSDPAAVGRTFRMAGRVYTIVGVLARGFTGTEPGNVTDFFVPSMMMDAQALKTNGWSWFRMWIRPRPGISREHVSAALQAGFDADQLERARQASSDTPKSQIDAMFKEQLLLLPAAAGVSGIQKTFRQPLWILAALAGLLVVLACANVANLLLARGMSRKVEMALRLSIGAARRRLVQLLLVESAMLAVIAAATGGVFAAWAAPFIVSMLAPAEIPVRLILDVDWRTLVIASALTLVVTVLFGLAPAWRASDAPLVDALKDVRGQHGHRRLADVLVGAQAACCVFLLLGATLFLGTLDRLHRRPLGFSSENLLHLVIDSARQHSAEDWAQLAASLRSLPRVQSAVVAGWAPLSGNRWRASITVAGVPRQATGPYWVSVAPGYLETMGMRLLEGRDFRPGDRMADKSDAGGVIPGVAIVNETFARVYFNGRNPVGQRVIVNSSKAPMEIVGLTADAVYFSVREADQPTVYTPLEPREGATVLVRTDGAALDLQHALRREIPRLRPDMQVREVLPFQSIITRQIIRERLLAALSSFFAVLALVLAVVGIYSVLNYAVTREQREIGLRMALGARPGHVVALITARLAGMVAIGAVAGLALGLTLGRFVQTLFFQMQLTDPAALAPPMIALAVAALLAILPPAIRAVRTDPARTIRTEG